MNRRFKKIGLVIGHQENNQGAYGSAGIGEWKFNSDLVEEIMNRHKGGNTFLYMRDKNISGYTSQMKDLHATMDSHGIEISIEFHFNSFSNENVRGHEVLYCYSSSGGKEEASELNECLDLYLPTSNRGIKPVTFDDDGGGFCCRGRSKALIIEPFFGANQDRFVQGGDLREDLILAILKYLREI